jgi:cysteine rich repeat protein
MPQGVHRRVAAQLVFIATKLAFIATRRVVLAGLLAVFLAVFLAIFLAALFASPVASQQPTSAQRDAIRSACRSDYEAHCASVPPGGKPALMCLQDNIASLSQSCQQAVNAIGVASPAPAAGKSSEAPAATAPAPSGAVPPAATSAAPKPSSAQVEAIRRACRTDYQAACADVPTGGAAALSCLQKNVASLSPPCQQAVNAAGGGSAPADAAATPTPEPKAGVAAAVVPVPRAISPRQEIFLVRSACREDFRRSCGDVPPGGGRIIGCLRANEASLSPRCQSALAPLVQSR